MGRSISYITMMGHESTTSKRILRKLLPQDSLRAAGNKATRESESSDVYIFIKTTYYCPQCTRLFL